MGLTHIIDRRLNGKNKSAVNRERFIRRYREHIKKAVADAVSKRSITDMDRGESINIPTRDIEEHVFRPGEGGKREIVHPGNREYVTGDALPKPPKGGGGGSGTGDASDSGEGMDEFVFTISQEEFLDFMFEDLELPNLVKKQLKDTSAYKYVRSGLSTAGIPAKINIVRSLRGAYGRRLALTGKHRNKIAELEKQLEELKAAPDIPDPAFSTADQIRALEDEIERLKNRIHKIPWIDDFDLRYNQHVKQPYPSTSAVMFCLMDVSGSMSQMHKEIAKRFFILLYLFLKRNYQKIDVVFIRHHTSAKEVDEQEFFYSRETGGTIVSSALKLMQEIVDERYSPSDWNIYAAQASDGDNWNDDSPLCSQILDKEILPKVQYFSYIEITPHDHQMLWYEYLKLTEKWPDQFAIQHLVDAADIYPGLPQALCEEVSMTDNKGEKKLPTMSVAAEKKNTSSKTKRKPISKGSDWTFELIEQYDREIAKIAKEYKLDTYPNQIEVISAEQMMDAYSSVGMPVGYHHWSFGKQFLNTSKRYRRGQMGLAYEIVINSNPCIAYLMEENTMMMQALVIAHASYGHNSFFKGNYLFQTWTDASAIIDYLLFAKNYIAECENRYGLDAVENILDSCHAIQNYGVDRYKRPSPISADEESALQQEREEYLQRQVNELWRTIPAKSGEKSEKKKKRFPPEPQENLLYFFEKNSPLLEPWQREVVRIVRKIAQYFYPQRQTQVMNEGWATFWHYTILNTLYDKGLVTDGFMMEFLQSHSAVIYQPPYDNPWFSGINPYTLGFNMFIDLRRICEHPTDEDKKWFPDIAGSDWLETLHFAMHNFKDESFILQFLSPKVMRDMKFFSIIDDEMDQEYHISAIHDDNGYRYIREKLARQYNLSYREPDIQVWDVDVRGDRSLTLRHTPVDNVPLSDQTDKVLFHVHRLWGFDVHLESVTSEGRNLGKYQYPPPPEADEEDDD